MNRDGIGSEESEMHVTCGRDFEPDAKRVRRKGSNCSILAAFPMQHAALPRPGFETSVWRSKHDEGCWSYQVDEKTPSVQDRAQERSPDIPTEALS